MATAQDVLIFVQDSLHLYDEATTDKIWRALHQQFYAMARTNPWSWLRRTKTLTAQTDPTEGVLMPADMIDVIGPIYDAENDVHYFLIDPAQAQYPVSARQCHYYFDDAGVTPLAQQKGISINADATAFSLSPGVAGIAGEYIQIGASPGYYLISSATALDVDSNNTGVLADAYRGPREKNSYHVIRPPSTRRLSFIDTTATNLVPACTVHYWALPLPLTKPQHFFPDHWLLPLQLGAWIQCMTDTTDGKGEPVRLSRQQEYVRALAEAKARDGQPAMTHVQRDNRGYVRRMGWR